MFFSPIKTEPIPERVLSICQIVADKGPIDEKKLEGILVPEKLSTAKTSYFRPVFDTAMELELIRRNDEELIEFSGNKDDIKSLSAFRMFCNSKVFSDSSTEFYKIISCFLSANDTWFKYGSVTTSSEIIRIINNETDIPSLKLEKDVILGVRFWINFLGFGYFQETDKIFLPNMYTALKDFMCLGNIEKGKEYSVEEFINALYSGSSVALSNVKETMCFNLAFSNALRLLHDNKEIQLQNNSDSEKNWFLFRNDAHVFTDCITHIVVKKVVK